MQEQLKVKINPQDTTEIVCDECGGKVFTEGLMLRTVNKFIAGTDSDALIPMNVIYCIKCYHVNDQFIPKLPGQ